MAALVAASRAAAACRVCAARLLADRAAVTTLEYALMGLMICAAIAGSVVGFAGGTGNLMASAFSQIAAAM
jgi:hypothetical protein